MKTTCLGEWKARAVGAGCEAGVKAPAVWPRVDESSQAEEVEEGVLGGLYGLVGGGYRG